MVELEYVIDCCRFVVFYFFQAEDGIRDYKVTGVQTCALPISRRARSAAGVDARARERDASEMHCRTHRLVSVTAPAARAPNATPSRRAERSVRDRKSVV